MAWTVISDATLEVGKALRALTMRNLRDNITALANGDAGAPKVQTAGIQDLAVTTDKIAASAVTTAKIAAGNVTSATLATGANEVNWVLARTAGAGTGAVGTYAFLVQSADTTAGINAGTSYAGSGLLYSGHTSVSGAVYPSGGSPGGTWLAMGQAVVVASVRRSTVFLRIA